MLMTQLVTLINAPLLFILYCNVSDMIMTQFITHHCCYGSILFFQMMMTRFVTHPLLINFDEVESQVRIVFVVGRGQLILHGISFHFIFLCRHGGTVDAFELSKELPAA